MFSRKCMDPLPDGQNIIQTSRARVRSAKLGYFLPAFRCDKWISVASSIYRRRGDFVRSGDSRSHRSTPPSRSLPSSHAQQIRQHAVASSRSSVRRIYLKRRPRHCTIQAWLGHEKPGSHDKPWSRPRLVLLSLPLCSANADRVVLLENSVHGSSDRTEYVRSGQEGMYGLRIGGKAWLQRTT